MKKLLILVAFAVIFAAATTSAMAGGDKVRGEEGEGSVVQECVNFDYCPYGGESPAH